MNNIAGKSWIQNIVDFFTSPSGMSSTISAIGLILTALVLSKLEDPSAFDENLYKDRLRRSTIQLLILSVLGFVLGIYLRTSSIERLNLEDRQSMTTILIIGILMLTVTADMVNSFTKISSGVDPLVKGLIASMLTVSIIVVIYAIYKLVQTTNTYQQWINKSVSSTPTISNFIMF
jgi:uncharacterized membrane protein